MAALAADVYYTTVGTPDKLKFSANGADTFYQGAIVYIDTAGGAQVVPAAGDRAVGLMCKQQVITAAAQEIEVYTRGNFWVPVGANITAADEGDVAVLDISATQSDNVADLVSATDITAASGDVIIGQILRVTATQMLLAIIPGVTGRLYAATATNAWI